VFVTCIDVFDALEFDGAHFSSFLLAYRADGFMLIQRSFGVD